MKVLVLVLAVALIAFVGVNLTVDTYNGPFQIRSGFVKGEY